MYDIVDVPFLLCYNKFVSCAGACGDCLRTQTPPDREVPAEGFSEQDRKGKTEDMFDVQKRDGEVAEFQLHKITEAMKKAFNATGKSYSDEILELMALRVTADFQDKIRDGLIHVEDVQDSVEQVLEQTGYTDVAKAYILYRKQREKIRNMKSTILDYKEVVNQYVNAEDCGVKENSTVTYSVGGLILSNSGTITANYWLSEVYDEEIANAHKKRGYPHS